MIDEADNPISQIVYTGNVRTQRITCITVMKYQVVKKPHVYTYNGQKIQMKAYWFRAIEMVVVEGTNEVISERTEDHGPLSTQSGKLRFLASYLANHKVALDHVGQLESFVKKLYIQVQKQKIL